MFHRHPARALALALSLTACGTTAGDDPRAGMSPVTVTRAPWRLWVHTPPWREVERGAERVVLRVASTQDGVLMGGTAGALVSLVAETARGVTADAWVRARYDESVQRGAQSRYAPRAARYLGEALPFTEAAALTYDGGARWAARALPDGSLLTLTLTAPWDLADDADITQLLASVDAPGGAVKPLLSIAVMATMCLAPRELRANERVRRTSVTLWYRHASLSLPGASGEYHGGGVSFLPLRALRAGRWLRWEIGAEAGVRAGPNAHHDVMVTSLMRVGWHRTFQHVTPWVVATGGAGLVAAERLRRTDAQWLWSVGAELGADLRVGGPFGFTAAVGFGRTVEGAVHHDGFWLRAGVAIFP